jgi:hypothetical protein
MGYLEEDERDEREDDILEDEEELRELEIDENGRIRRGPVVRPDELEDEFDGESEDEDNPYSEAEED